MAIDTVTKNTKFDEWKDITNAIISGLGDNDSLTTTEKSSLVAAINEINSLIGDLGDLDTSTQANLVAAINEVLSKLGTVANLDTTATNAVAAINELLAAIGVMGDLTTTNTSTLVTAINSLKTEVGNLASLSTTVNSSLVGATNEVNSKVGDLTILTTTSQASAVAAINELDGDVGDLDNLSTATKTSLVAATNEVLNLSAVAKNVQYTNQEPNGGRNATTDLTIIATASPDFTLGLISGYNTASFGTGDKFVNDNSNYGGAGASLGTDASSLVAALGSKGGRTNLRYGYEFYINDITAGAGTSDGITVSTLDYYPVVENSEVMLGSINQKVTWMAWMRLKTLATPANNGIILGDDSGQIDVYIDGSLVSSPYLLEVVDGWVHVKQVITLDTEFYNFFPAIYGNSGDVIQVVLPVVAPAEIKYNLHVGLVK